MDSIIDIYELLNRTSSRIVRVAAASGLAQQFRIVLPPKVKVKNSTSSVYSSLYGIYKWRGGKSQQGKGQRLRRVATRPALLLWWPHSTAATVNQVQAESRHQLLNAMAIYNTPFPSYVMILLHKKTECPPKSYKCHHFRLSDGPPPAIFIFFLSRLPGHTIALLSYEVKFTV